mmetsp:Transcript_107158/g.334026  ORF Transcript_107158/g.334026 Transcript_107158/m.334026 type:complete len:244 (+) Transcript_107158:1501-2232(+)
MRLSRRTRQRLQGQHGAPTSRISSAWSSIAARAATQRPQRGRCRLQGHSHSPRARAHPQHPSREMGFSMWLSSCKSCRTALAKAGAYSMLQRRHGRSRAPGSRPWRWPGLHPRGRSMPTPTEDPKVSARIQSQSGRSSAPEGTPWRRPGPPPHGRSSTPTPARYPTRRGRGRGRRRCCTAWPVLRRARRFSRPSRNFPSPTSRSLYTPPSLSPEVPGRSPLQWSRRSLHPCIAMTPRRGRPRS